MSHARRVKVEPRTFFMEMRSVGNEWVWAMLASATEGEEGSAPP